ncbi:zinc finger domain-containing protein [Micromonospora peucetia]|uniref:zinc finger domain-containing protein n=1 Tax=Micromonospora peucetia TaxID=47871 RepID=UPI003F5DD861
MPTYPIVDCDDPSAEVTVAEPHIQRSDGRLYIALCTYCPDRPGQVADPREPATWLEYGESSYDLDEQRGALTRHLTHHQKQADPTAALPIWTWSDHACPRCDAPPEHKCRTRSGRPSTAVHAERWHDHSGEYW